MSRLQADSGLTSHCAQHRLSRCFERGQDRDEQRYLATGPGYSIFENVIAAASDFAFDAGKRASLKRRARRLGVRRSRSYKGGDRETQDQKAAHARILLLALALG